MKIWRARLATGLGTIVLGLSTLAIAQEQEQEQDSPGQEPPNKAVLATEINDGRKHNAAQMRNYSWNTRTEIIIDGEVKSDKVELIRFTPEGELQKAVVSDSSAGAKKPRGVRGRVASKKVKGMQEWGAELGKLLQQYSLPTSGSILDFLDLATAETTGNMVNLVGRNVIQQGDYMAMLVDAGSKQLKIIEVKTSLDGDAVHVQIISKNLDDGLSYTAQQVVKVPARKVELIVENYDFRRQ
jgi:hypothetical protein